MANIQRIAEELINLSTDESIELTNILEMEYGIKPKRSNNANRNIFKI